MEPTIPDSSTWTSTSNGALLSILLGAFLPPLISIIYRPTWPKWLRALVTAFICIVVGVVKCYALNLFTAEDILRSIIFVLLGAWNAYREFWKPTGIAPNIEAATSPAPKQTNQIDPEVKP